MVNTNKIKAKMVEAGLTLRKLSPIVGIGVTALGKKINGQSAFTLPEVEKMCKALSIRTNDEKCDIFLSQPSQ